MSNALIVERSGRVATLINDDAPRNRMSLSFMDELEVANDRAGTKSDRDPVARGELRLDDHLYRGTVGGRPAMTFPFEVTAEVLERGRERYDIFCSTCHDRTGSGDGLVVQRCTRRADALGRVPQRRGSGRLHEHLRARRRRNRRRRRLPDEWRRRRPARRSCSACS